MALLALGILLWSAVHLSTALARGFRAGAIAKIGLHGWKSIYSLLLIGALYLIVQGWQAATPTYIYNPPAALRHVAMALMPLAIILFVSARLPTNIKRLTRHPLLNAVKLWAIAHLLANGDSRSLLLFGAFFAWALLEMILINKRDGKAPWPDKVPVWRDALVVVLGIVVTGLLVRFHVYFAGMPLMG